MNGTGSVVVDDVSLTDATDFDRLALDALRGGGQFGSRRGDNFPVDWIFRAYDELKARSSPFADRPAAGVAACLTAPEPEVRAQALVFFQRHPRAAGGERVVDLVAGDRELFAGVPDPVYPCTDLFWQLLAALAARLASGDERALERAQSEVLRPGDALPLVAELAAAAPAWAFAHAESIAQGTPAAGASLLIQLQNSGRDVVALAERIADWCQADPRFELDISRFIDNPAMRREILLKFHSFEG